MKKSTKTKETESTSIVDFDIDKLADKALNQLNKSSKKRLDQFEREAEIARLEMGLHPKWATAIALNELNEYRIKYGLGTIAETEIKTPAGVVRKIKSFSGPKILLDFNDMEVTTYEDKASVFISELVKHFPEYNAETGKLKSNGKTVTVTTKAMFDRKTGIEGIRVFVSTGDSRGYGEYKGQLSFSNILKKISIA